jgi:hypothetical protein
MFIAKPQKFHQVTDLDVNGADLDTIGVPPVVKIFPLEQPGPFANPDGAAGRLGATPGVMEVQTGGPLRTENVSGKGVMQKTAINDAPKSRP